MHSTRGIAKTPAQTWPQVQTKKASKLVPELRGAYARLPRISQLRRPHFSIVFSLGRNPTISGGS